LGGLKGDEKITANRQKRFEILFVVLCRCADYDVSQTVMTGTFDTKKAIRRCADSTSSSAITRLTLYYSDASGVPNANASLGANCRGRNQDEWL